LSSAVPGGRITPDIISEPDSRIGPVAGFVNERALLEAVEAVHSRVGATLAAGRFPLIYGADCSVLLGAIPAVRGATGSAGLLFIDGHEDTTTGEHRHRPNVMGRDLAAWLELTPCVDARR
jgi:arginase